MSRSDGLVAVDLSLNHANLDVLVGVSCAMAKKSLKSESKGSGSKRKLSSNEAGMEENKEKCKQKKLEVSE